MKRISVWKHDDKRTSWAKDLTSYIILCSDPVSGTKAHVLYCMDGIGPVLRPTKIKPELNRIPSKSDSIEVPDEWVISPGLAIPLIKVALDDKWEFSIDTKSAQLVHRESLIAVCSFSPNSPSAPAEVAAAWAALRIGWR